MPIYLTAPNSPARDIARADVKCSDQAHLDIQKAADEAKAMHQVLVFAPGWYRIGETLNVDCGLEGIGYANLAWIGASGGWIVETQGAVSGLYLYCDGKARALKVNDAHNVTFENLHIFTQANEGLRIEKGWCVTVHNVRSLGGTGTAFRFEAFNSSIAKRLAAVNIRSTIDGVLCCDGQGSTLSTVAFEDCDGPAVRLKGFDGGSLDGLYTERISGHAIVRIENSVGAKLSQCFHWQRPEGPIDVGVDVIGSKGVEIDGVDASNIRDAIVRIDADSNLGGCTARNIVDRYGKLDPKSSGYKQVVQPRHIVDVRGYNHEPVKEQTETDDRKG